jgi:hypothetical protein
MYPHCRFPIIDPHLPRCAYSIQPNPDQQVHLRQHRIEDSHILYLLVLKQRSRSRWGSLYCKILARSRSRRGWLP